MKNNVQYNGEALMLLADFLHNILLSRERFQSMKNAHEKSKKIDKSFDDAFKRLCRSVDFGAKQADKLLKCRITRIATPYGSEKVFINIQPSRRRKVINKNV